MNSPLDLITRVIQSTIEASPTEINLFFDHFKLQTLKADAVDLQVHYQFSNTRVEVNGIGDDQWHFSSLHFTVGILF